MVSFWERLPIWHRSRLSVNQPTAAVIFFLSAPCSTKMLAGTRAFACESSQELLAYQLTYTSPSRLVWKDRNGKELETIGKRTREKLKNTAAALHVILRSRKVDKDAAHHLSSQSKEVRTIFPPSGFQSTRRMYASLTNAVACRTCPGRSRAMYREAMRCNSRYTTGARWCMALSSPLFQARRS
jgi:hypothetical protein